MDELKCRPVALVSAPAGFGKSTLVAEWARGCGLPVAWLSLEVADSDPAHLLASLVAALRKYEQEIGVEALEMLYALQRPSLVMVAESLLRDLARHPDPLVLVLDDYHVVSRPEVDVLLSHVVQRLPEGLHLCIATRVDPALPLARMRAQAQLAEVRADDLRFRLEEAAAFLRQAMGLDLQEEDVALLEEQTEGWAAGLQMAALSLHGKTDRSQFIRSFSGTHRYVMDYLVGEVLEEQPAKMQEFLLSTSILERFRAELCNEVVGCTGSQTVLEALDRRNLFVVALDEERIWYRYHHLFAELLRHRLKRQRRPEELAELHLRAGRWLEESGESEEAMRHFLAGGKHQEAMLLMDSCHEAILTRGGLGTLLGWVRQLPGEQVQKNPEASMTIGTVYVWAGRPQDAERHIALAEALLARETGAADTPRARSLHGRAAIMRAYMADVAGATGRALELAREGDDLLRSDVFSIPRSLVPYILCRAYRYKGDLEQAKTYARIMIGMARSAGNVWALASPVHELIWLCRHQGRLREAELVFKEFDAFPREAGSAGPIARVTAGLGEIQRERGDLGEAARSILAAQENVSRWGVPSDIYFCRILRIRLALSQGNIADAAEEVRRADEIARGALVYSSMFPLLEAERARVFLARAMVRQALAWMEGCPPPEEANVMNREVIHIAHARVLIAAGRNAEASELLDRLASEAEAGGRFGRLLEILVLRAAARAGHEGLVALRRAIEIAEPEGWVRIFLDEGEPVVRLLRDLLDRPHALDPRLATYARGLISMAGL